MVEIFKDTFGGSGEFYSTEKWETRLGVWLMCWHKIQDENKRKEGGIDGFYHFSKIPDGTEDPEAG
jgi:hypothetical protein